jgi:hypothetical protein
VDFDETGKLFCADGNLFSFFSLLTLTSLNPPACHNIDDANIIVKRNFQKLQSARIFTMMCDEMLARHFAYMFTGLATEEEERCELLLE